MEWCDINTKASSGLAKDRRALRECFAWRNVKPDCEKSSSETTSRLYCAVARIQCCIIISTFHFHVKPGRSAKHAAKSSQIHPHAFACSDLQPRISLNIRRSTLFLRIQYNTQTADLCNNSPRIPIAMALKGVGSFATFLIVGRKSTTPIFDHTHL